MKCPNCGSKMQVVKCPACKSKIHIMQKGNEKDKFYLQCETIDCFNIMTEKVLD